MKTAAARHVPAAVTIAAARECLYEALPYVLLRAPLLPVESYLSLPSEECQRALLADAKVQAALGVGSPSLSGAIDRFQAGALNRRDTDRMLADRGR